MKFRIEGEIKLGSAMRPFSKEVEADSENHAKEMVYALLGSQNGVRRSNVKVEKLEKV